ncbi:MAG: GNAT family N-acetyltransferase [Bacteroidia bacterium]|nr:GNAT family N-acetyltransferase [Bacteroidia bacterium]
MDIKRANRFDTTELSSLTFRSKSYWGYDSAQIKAWESELRLSEEYIENKGVYKLLGEHVVIGYYSYFELNRELVKLDNLFVDPPFIGQGYGKILLDDFLQRIQKLGYKEVHLDADPHAESFYIKHGFKIIGHLESSIKNRFLPVMAMEL